MIQTTPDRLDKIEQRLDRIEQVLVALGYAVHGWGLGKQRFRKPGEKETPYNRTVRASPFEAIADLFTNTG